jgi:hypothetical protein
MGIVPSVSGIDGRFLVPGRLKKPGWSAVIEKQQTVHEGFAGTTDGGRTISVGVEQNARCCGTVFVTVEQCSLLC